MIPQRFARSNCVMHAPPGMENCADVHACATTQGDCPVVVTAWRPTPEELVKLNLGEPVWLVVWGAGMPPVCVTAHDPFVGNEGNPSENG